jgi:hypothetical protein
MVDHELGRLAQERDAGPSGAKLRDARKGGLANAGEQVASGAGWVFAGARERVVVEAVPRRRLPRV